MNSLNHLKSEIEDCTELLEMNMINLEGMLKEVHETFFKLSHDELFEKIQEIYLLAQKLECDDAVLKTMERDYRIFKRCNGGKNRMKAETKEKINQATRIIESCWDENNPNDNMTFDERLTETITNCEDEQIKRILKEAAEL